MNLKERIWDYLQGLFYYCCCGLVFYTLLILGTTLIFGINELVNSSTCSVFTEDILLKDLINKSKSFIGIFIVFMFFLLLYFFGIELSEFIPSNIKDKLSNLNKKLDSITFDKINIGEKTLGYILLSLCVILITLCIVNIIINYILKDLCI